MATDTSIVDSLERNPLASVLDFSNAYFELRKRFGHSVPVFNAQVNRLKNLCMSRGIDHSGFKPFGMQPLRGGRVTVPRYVKLPVKTLPMTVQEAPPVEKIVEIYEEHFSYFSYAMIEVLAAATSTIEKFGIVYGAGLDRQNLKAKFSADVVIDLAEFKGGALDRLVKWRLLFLFHSAKTKSSDVRAAVHSLGRVRYFSRVDFNNEEESVFKVSQDELFHDTSPANEHNIVYQALTAEEECLIKKFFGDDSGFLVCNRLSGGFSGSSVYLVYSLGRGDRKKKIIKVRPKDGTDKLSIEHQNFKRDVDSYHKDQTTNCTYHQTANYTAICYPFASLNETGDSKSFSRTYLEHKDPQDLRVVVRRIFDHDLIKRWRVEPKPALKSVASAFKEVFSWNEVQKELSYVESICGRRINRELIAKIMDIEFNFAEATSHGDLHSDNIQIDSAGQVHLIDFGMTGTFPLGFDHAVLECSILFKLLDQSIESKMFEDSILSRIDSFESVVEISDRDVEPSQKALKTCALIRSHFLETYKNDPELERFKTQYLFCMLSICIRGLGFSDLNRRVLILTLEKLANLLEMHTKV
ncbi:MAG: hypothetical protein EOP06_00060 [Proteobacteria bacterium]|nr:MAG: hypothetical protein EOP06_00060 [Pseudomonadota bacterium]